MRKNVMLRKIPHTGVCCKVLAALEYSPLNCGRRILLGEQHELSERYKDFNSNNI